MTKFAILQYSMVPTNTTTCIRFAIWSANLKILINIRPTVVVHNMTRLQASESENKRDSERLEEGGKGIVGWDGTNLMRDLR